MSLFELIGVLFVMLSCLGVVNHLTLKLPDTLGITAVGLIISMLLILVVPIFPDLTVKAKALTSAIDFQEVVFHGILSFLLFAGSMQIKIETIAKERWAILALATVGVVISTVIIGTMLWWTLPLVGVALPMIYCLLFGALISPTDPVVVMEVLKKCNLSENLQAKISGESLFNDATGIVMFTIVAGIAGGKVHPTFVTVGNLLIQEIAGAITIGFVTGYFAYWVIKQVENYPLEILVTLCLPTAAYSLAENVHVNGPLTVVIAGLIIGNKGLVHAVSDKTKAHMLHFWELTDELLNIVLFGLIGLQLLVLDLSWMSFAYGAFAILACIVGRYFSVALPIAVIKKSGLGSKDTLILTWGGLRGAISIALALSLVESEYKNILLTLTYAVVVFSILVQAPTLKRVINRLTKNS